MAAASAAERMIKGRVPWKKLAPGVAAAEPFGFTCPILSGAERAVIESGRFEGACTVTISLPPPHGSALIEQPSLARVYDCLLGGAHNFATDRRVAAAQCDLVPNIRGIARGNRALLRRVVLHALDLGVNQFLDIGAGIPTVGNVHDIIGDHDPAARCVYVDHDPIAVMLLHRSPHAAVQADFRDPDTVLTEVRSAGVLDFDRPIALLLLDMLQFVPHEHEPAKHIARYRDAIVPGSLVAMSHLTNEGVPEPHRTNAAKYQATFNLTPTPACLRTRAELHALFDGFNLDDPGIVWVSQWRPGVPVSADERDHARSMTIVGFGHK